MLSLHDVLLFLAQGVDAGEGGAVAGGAGLPLPVHGLALHVALLREVADHDGDAAAGLVPVLSPAAAWVTERVVKSAQTDEMVLGLTHFVRLGPGQLGEVAEVGFVLDDGVVVDDGLGDAVLGVKPEVEHLIKALHDRLRVCLLYTSPSPRDGLLSRMPSSA